MKVIKVCRYCNDIIEENDIPKENPGNITERCYLTCKKCKKAKEKNKE